MDGLIIFLAGKFGHLLKKPGFSAAGLPGDKLDLAPAIPDVFLKIFFNPEIRKKMASGGLRVKCWHNYLFSASVSEPKLSASFA